MKLPVVCNSADLGRAGWPALLLAATAGVSLLQVTLLLLLGRVFSWAMEEAQEDK